VQLQQLHVFFYVFICNYVNAYCSIFIADAACVLKLKSPKEDYASLLEAIGDAQVVMIGEATHGTKEFYEHRAEISKLLIEEKVCVCFLFCSFPGFVGWFSFVVLSWIFAF